MKKDSKRFIGLTLTRALAALCAFSLVYAMPGVPLALAETAGAAAEQVEGGAPANEDETPQPESDPAAEGGTTPAEPPAETPAEPTVPTTPETPAQGEGTQTPEQVTPDSSTPDQPEGSDETETPAPEDEQSDEQEEDLEAQEVPTPTVTYQAHVQDYGWMKEVKDGADAGTHGESKRVEALKVNVSGVDNLGIQYMAHIQNIGWKQGWKANGEEMGTDGQSLRVEAVRLQLTGEAASQYHVWYRVHVQNIGWMGWTCDGAKAGTAGQSLRVEAIQIFVLPADQPAPSGDGQATADAFSGTRLAVQYQAHVQNIGWQGAVQNGSVAGTTGRSLRVEALRVSLVGDDVTDGTLSGGVEYQAHVQNIGWQDWTGNGGTAGTSGQSLRVEAIRMRLTGAIASSYHIYYRAHVQNIGWMAWAKDGEAAGSEGSALRVEAVQVVLVPNGGSAPSADGQASSLPFVKADSVSYHTQSAGQDWQGWTSDGNTAGTTGQGRAVERFAATVDGGGVQYRAYSAYSAWGSWVADGAEAGIAGRRIEAIQMQLTGEAANRCDLYYRVHVANIGWMGWAKNGEEAGTEGGSLQVEAVQVKLVVKGAAAPGSTASHFQSAVSGKIGYQNPSWMWQVSSHTVSADWTHGHGQFSYVTPSRISVTASRDEVVNAFIQRAREYIGTPYVWDYACAPGVGVDCAGLILQCGYAVGMDFGDMNPVNHYYAGGWHSQYANALWNSGNAPHVSVSDMQPGDVISYPGHVAIYVGNGSMIEAPYAGATVRETPVRYSGARGAIRLFS